MAECELCGECGQTISVCRQNAISVKHLKSDMAMLVREAKFHRDTIFATQQENDKLREAGKRLLTAYERRHTASPPIPLAPLYKLFVEPETYDG